VPLDCQSSVFYPSTTQPPMDTGSTSWTVTGGLNHSSDGAWRSYTIARLSTDEIWTQPSSRNSRVSAGSYRHSRGNGSEYAYRYAVNPWIEVPDLASTSASVSSLRQRNSTLNLTALFAVVLRVLRNTFGFIFLNYFSHYYVFLYHFVYVIVCVLFCSCCIRAY